MSAAAAENLRHRKTNARAASIIAVSTTARVATEAAVVPPLTGSGPKHPSRDRQSSVRLSLRRSCGLIRRIIGALLVLSGASTDGASAFVTSPIGHRGLTSKMDLTQLNPSAGAFVPAAAGAAASANNGAGSDNGGDEVVYRPSESGDAPAATASNPVAAPSSWAAAASSAPPQQTPPNAAAKTKKAPLYIPIGPQCSGKTTMLRRMLNGESAAAASKERGPITGASLSDVTIDDQPGVYVRVPTRLFIAEAPSIVTTTSDADRRANPDASLLRSNIHGKTVEERLYRDGGSNDEMRAVLRRLAGKISKEDVEKILGLLPVPLPTPTESTGNDNGEEGGYDSTPQTLKRQKSNDGLAVPMGGMRVTSDAAGASSAAGSGNPGNRRPKNRDDTELAAQWALAAAVEYHLEHTIPALPEDHPTLGSAAGETDLFVVEGIFRSAGQGPDGRNLGSGLNNALHKLTRLANAKGGSGAVAWGNTNTRPREYVTALEAAEKSGRPVVFLPFACREELGICPTCEDDTYIPPVDMEELMRRNVGRLIDTGRYVPSKAVADATVRCEQLLMGAKADMRRAASAKDPVVAAAIIDEERGSSASEEAKESTAEPSKPTKFQLDAALAAKAGYDMLPDRTVRRRPGQDQGGGRGRGGGRGGYYGRGRGSGGRGGRLDGGGWRGGGRFNDRGGGGRGRGWRDDNRRRDGAGGGRGWHEHNQGGHGRGWRDDRGGGRGGNGGGYDGRGEWQDHQGGRGGGHGDQWHQQDSGGGGGHHHHGSQHGGRGDRGGPGGPPRDQRR